MENDMKSSQRLCDRIRKLRKQHGEFQKDLAYALNKSESAVRMWELGRSEPDVETIKLIAKRYSVSVSYLVGDDDEELYACFLSPEEQILIAAYRDRPEMQAAVNTLLGVDEIIEEMQFDAAEVNLEESWHPDLSDEELYERLINAPESKATLL